MTTCQVCHEREATVHFTQVTDEQVSTVHLCSRCAAERGVALPVEPAMTPLGSFLATLGPNTPESAGREPVGVCPECGATLADIRASGRLGCASCWSTFDRPLRDLVRRLHGADRHVGSWYADPAVAGNDALRLAHERLRLQDALRDAIAAEAFEEAAALRDQLRDLDPS